MRLTTVGIVAPGWNRFGFPMSGGDGKGIGLSISLVPLLPMLPAPMVAVGRAVSGN